MDGCVVRGIGVKSLMKMEESLRWKRFTLRLENGEVTCLIETMRRWMSGERNFGMRSLMDTTLGSACQRRWYEELDENGRVCQVQERHLETLR
jgi:hypothetical protein